MQCSYLDIKEKAEKPKIILLRPLAQIGSPKCLSAKWKIVAGPLQEKLIYKAT